MRVLIACEFSGVVRRAFQSRGHEVWSCDLLPSEDLGDCTNDSFPYFPAYTDGWGHIQADVLKVLGGLHEHFICKPPVPWDLMIAFPPCTDLAVSGARWFPAKRESGEQQRSIDFFLALANAPIERIAIENPIGIMSTHYRKPDQIIQPWQFGHPETKATCLWLKNLPKLMPTNIVEGRRPRVHHEPPSPDRWKNRSRTLQGIADALAEQWGGLIQ